MGMMSQVYSLKAGDLEWPMGSSGGKRAFLRAACKTAKEVNKTVERVTPGGGDGEACEATHDHRCVCSFFACVGSFRGRGGLQAMLLRALGKPLKEAPKVDMVQRMTDMDLFVVILESAWPATTAVREMAGKMASLKRKVCQILS